MLKKEGVGMVCDLNERLSHCSWLPGDAQGQEQAEPCWVHALELCRGGHTCNNKDKGVGT